MSEQKWKERAEALWQILDDIDTLDDAIKNDDTSFRKWALEYSYKRHEILSSDGYNLSVPSEV